MTTFKSNGSLCIFAKTPELGKVKTRLENALGQQGCLELHKWLVKDRLAKFCWTQADREYEVLLYVTDNPKDKFWIELNSSSSAQNSHGQVPILLQSGVTLGERLWHAVKHTLDRQEWVILIGADCPDLDAHYVDIAISELENGRDAVIGPAEDGGYVLLGLRQSLKQVFQGISWGSDRVFDETVAVFKHLGLDYRVLSRLKDLDVMDDYLYYKSKMSI